MTSVIHPIITPMLNHPLKSQPQNLGGSCVLGLFDPYINISDDIWYDASLQGNSAAIVGGVRNGGGLYFDSIDDSVSVSGASALLTGAKTICCWIKPENDINQPIIGWSSSAITPAILWRLAGTDPIIYLGPNNYRYFSGSAAITDENWHHVTIRITGIGQNDIANSSFSIDEVALTQSIITHTGAVSTANTTTLGLSFNHFLGGNMDSVLMFNRVLTAKESETIYNQTKEFYQ